MDIWWLRDAPFWSLDVESSVVAAAGTVLNWVALK